MDADLTATIARHYPDKDKAARIISALESVIDQAEAQLDDLRAGIEQGIYEETPTRATIEWLTADLALLRGEEGDDDSDDDEQAES